MTDRKFYHTTIEIKIVSEDPIPSGKLTIADVAHEIVYGDWSGRWKIADSKQLNGKEAATALLEQGSDPEFFQIDEEGDDIDD